MANLNNFSGKFRKEIKESIVEIGTGQVIKSKEKTTYAEKTEALPFKRVKKWIQKETNTNQPQLN